MARRIRWQILIATVSSLLVLGLMAYLALTTAAVARPLNGGAYVEGVVGAPQQLNPLVSDPTRDPTGADIQKLLFDGLMRTGADGLPEPALAQAWEVNDAGTVYTFTLRADVTWHDGTPLTADDVLFTLRAVQGRGFAGDSSVGDIWRNVLVDKVGERSVRCTLGAPSSAGRPSRSCPHTCCATCRPSSGPRHRSIASRSAPARTSSPG